MSIIDKLLGHKRKLSPHDEFARAMLHEFLLFGDEHEIVTSGIEALRDAVSGEPSPKAHDGKVKPLAGSKPEQKAPKTGDRISDVLGLDDVEAEMLLSAYMDRQPLERLGELLDQAATQARNEINARAAELGAIVRAPDTTYGSLGKLSALHTAMLGLDDQFAELQRLRGLAHDLIKKHHPKAAALGELAK